MSARITTITDVCMEVHKHTHTQHRHSLQACFTLTRGGAVNVENFSFFLGVPVGGKDNTIYNFYRSEIGLELMELGQVRNKSCYVVCVTTSC